jgi:hypothetical protein
MPTGNAVSRKVSQVRVSKIDTKVLSGCFFANEYILMPDKTSYELMRRIVKTDTDTTSLRNGCTEIPLSTKRMPIFNNLLGKYCARKDVVLERIFIQETGEHHRGYAPHNYGTIPSTMIRILVNIRPPEQDQALRGTPKTVGIGVTIGGMTEYIMSRNGFSVALAGDLANISIYSGTTIPTTRRDCAQSLFVVMDVSCDDGTKALIAEELYKQKPISKEDLIEGIAKAGLSIDELAAELNKESKETPNAEPSIDTSEHKDSPDTNPSIEERGDVASGNRTPDGDYASVMLSKDSTSPLPEGPSLSDSTKLPDSEES